MKRTKVLFLCGKNRERSLTAEYIFAGRPDLEVRSAGLDNDAEYQCTAEDVEWAHRIFVMEASQKDKLSLRFKPQLKNARVSCLNIRNKYKFMDTELVRLLHSRVNAYLPSQRPASPHPTRRLAKPPFSIT